MQGGPWARPLLTIICFNTTHTLHGTVIKSTGSWYLVRTDEGECVECKVKGNFRLRGIRSTNPVAVGDKVTLLRAEGAGNAFITDIDERRNYIVRRHRTYRSKATYSPPTSTSPCSW